MNEQRKTLIKSIYSALQKGEISQGDKLLSERDLAEKFNCKRTTLRESLISLEALGIIDIRERQGIFIGGAGLENFTRGLDLLTSSSPVDFLSQIYEVRMMLEASTAELAAARRTDRDIVILRQEMDFFRYLLKTDHPDKGPLASQHNIILHNLIGAAARNALLQRIHEELSKLSQNAIAAMGTTGLHFHPFSRWPDQLLQEHHDIVEAIANGDGNRAKAAIVVHLENSKRRNQSVRLTPNGHA